MCMRALPWDNDLVNRKEEQMTSITIIESDQLGYDSTFVIRPCESGVSLAEVDPDFGFESFLGVYGSEAAAFDRIEMLVG